MRTTTAAIATRALPALLLALLLTVGTPPTDRAGAEPLRQAPEAADRPRLVDLVSQTTWITPDGDVGLRLDVGDADPADRLVVTFHNRLPGRYVLAESMAGEGLGRPMRTILDGTIAELDPDGDRRIDAILGLRSGPGDESRLRVTREGLHPIQVTLTRTDGDDVTEDGFVTHVVRLPTSVEQTLAVVLAQTLDAAPSRQQDGTTLVSDTARARLTQATGSFAGDAAVPVTYRLTTETLDALASTGNPLDAELLDDLAGLAAAGDLAASPFVRIDPDALVDSGLGEVVATQLARGALGTAIHLGVASDGTTWIADPDLGPAGLATLVDAGVQQLIVSHETLVGDHPALLVEPFTLHDADERTVTALATDGRLQSHIGSTGSAVLDAQHVLTELASIWFERPADARATALVLPADVADRVTLDALRRGLGDAPLLTVTDLPGAIAAATPAVEADAAERLTLSLVEPDARGYPSYGTLLARTVADLDTYGTIAGPGPTIDAYQAQIATSASADLTGDERRAFLVGVRDDIASRAANLGMPERGAVTLPSRDGVIPLTLVNNTGAPASVVVDFTSDKLEFPDGERLEITLTEPHTPIEVRVRARASGAFPLEMTMSSPDGRMVLVESRYTVRSTAVSGLGIALSVAAVLVLGVWWIRTARRARAHARN